MVSKTKSRDLEYQSSWFYYSINRHYTPGSAAKMNQFFKSLPILCLFTLVGAQYGNPGNSGTSTVTSSSPPSSTTTSATAVQTITVGASGLSFSPDTLTVSPGGKVEFHFQSGNHSVAQASFANPCHPMSDTSFSSGFVSGSNGGSVSRSSVE